MHKLIGIWVENPKKHDKREQSRRGGQRHKEYLTVTFANESINKNSNANV